MAPKSRTVLFFLPIFLVFAVATQSINADLFNNNFPIWTWATHTGSSTFDKSTSITSDLNDNIYGIGEIPKNPTNVGETVDFGNGVSLLLGTANSDLFIVKYDHTNTPVWVESIEANGNPRIIDIVSDNIGSIYVTGYFFNDATFGGSTTITANNLRFSTFVAKYNSSGNFQWVRHTVSPSTTANEICMDLTTDGSSVYLTGYFNGSFTFGNQSVTSNGGEDIFITKIASGGTVQWLKREGGTDNDRGRGITYNGTTITLTGSFKGITTIAGNTISANGQSDFYIAQYNTSGTPLWIDHAGSTSVSDRGTGISANKVNGDLFVAGSFGGTMIIGGTTITSPGGTDLFVAKYNNAGIFQWVQQSSGSGILSAGNIVYDGVGNIIILGEYSGNLTIGGTTINATSQKEILVQYQDDGTFDCINQTAGNPFGGASSKARIAAGGSGVILKSGNFSGSITLGGQILNSNGAEDLYFAKIDLNFLPIDLTTFTAMADQRSVILNWITSYEEDFDRFEIQRKIGNNEFMSIGSIKGKGGLLPTSYSFQDKEIPLNKTLYYRLKFVDFDQSFDYSEIEVVKVKGPEDTYQFYPNPTNDILHFYSSSKENIRTLSVFNSQRKMIFKLRAPSPEKHHYEINVSTWPPGIYFAQIIPNRGEIITLPIIISEK